jgi:hypothetical protein
VGGQSLEHRRQTAVMTQPGNAGVGVGVTGGAFSPGSKTLAIASSDGTTCVWNVATGVDYGYSIDLWNSSGTRRIAAVTDPRGNNPPRRAACAEPGWHDAGRCRPERPHLPLVCPLTQWRPRTCAMRAFTT